MATKKQIEKQQRDMRKVQTKEEVIELINKHAKVERVYIESAVGIIRQTLQSQIIANLALADVLIQQGIITQEEFDAKKKQLLGL